MPHLPTTSVPKDIFPWPRRLAQKAQMQAQKEVPPSNDSPQGTLQLTPSAPTLSSVEGAPGPLAGVLQLAHDHQSRRPECSLGLFKAAGSLFFTPEMSRVCV